MKKTILLAISCAIFSLPAQADWQNAGKVTRIHTGHGTPEYGPYFLFSTSTKIQVTGCENNYGYIVNETITSADRIYSTLLMAYASGKEVAIFTTGRCSAANRPEVNAIQIKDTDYF